MVIATRPLLRRLIALDRMLRERRYPNSCTAAKELEVSSRTIYRVRGLDKALTARPEHALSFQTLLFQGTAFSSG